MYKDLCHGRSFYFQDMLDKLLGVLGCSIWPRIQVLSLACQAKFLQEQGLGCGSDKLRKFETDSHDSMTCSDAIAEITET